MRDKFETNNESNSVSAMTRSLLQKSPPINGSDISKSSIGEEVVTCWHETCPNCKYDQVVAGGNITVECPKCGHVF